LNHFHIGEKALGFRQLETELKEQQEINSRVQRALQPIKEENEALKVELQRLEDRLSSSDRFVWLALSSSITEDGILAELFVTCRSYPIPTLHQILKSPHPDLWYPHSLVISRRM